MKFVDKKRNGYYALHKRSADSGELHELALYLVRKVGPDEARRLIAMAERLVERMRSF